MLQPLLLMIVAFYFLFACALLLNMRSELLRRGASTQWVRALVNPGESKRTSEGESRAV